MSIIAAYVAALVVFLAVDAVMLKAVLKPMFEKYIGDKMMDEPDLGVAAVFYLFYVAGGIFLCVMPALAAGSVGVALLNGAILGLCAYGTYEFTNKATIKGWAWPMTATDTAWGMVLTAGSMAAGYWAGSLVG